MNRRSFLGAAAGATGVLLTTPSIAFGAEANSAIRLGIIGCGGRGKWIADLFRETAGARIVGLHDYFLDRVQEAAQIFEVPPDRCYTGLEGYRELIASNIDAVAIESPPYFHPEQAVAALEAGKHVYLAKPIAVDVPGCNAIVSAAKKHAATLTCLVDFQTRNDALFREAAQRVHDGEIGAPICGQVFYHTGRLNKQTEPGSAVARLRNWVFDKALSGDIIVEQNIHVLDVANWFLSAKPVYAIGDGGRRGRVDVGDCWDHFIVAYRYPGDVLMDFSSSQFTTGFNDLCTRIYGSEGVVDAHYGGEVYIKSKKGTWPGGETTRIYRDGAVNNIRDFCSSIREGKPIQNVEESSSSTLTSILGRISAYEKRPVSWDEMMTANARLDAMLELPADGARAFS